MVNNTEQNDRATPQSLKSLDDQYLKERGQGDGATSSISSTNTEDEIDPENNDPQSDNFLKSGSQPLRDGCGDALTPSKCTSQQSCAEGKSSRMSVNQEERERRYISFNEAKSSYQRFMENASDDNDGNELSLSDVKTLKNASFECQSEEQSDKLDEDLLVESTRTLLDQIHLKYSFAMLDSTRADKSTVIGGSRGSNLDSKVPRREKPGKKQTVIGAVHQPARNNQQSPEKMSTPACIASLKEKRENCSRNESNMRKVETIPSQTKPKCRESEKLLTVQYPLAKWEPVVSDDRNSTRAVCGPRAAPSRAELLKQLQDCEDELKELDAEESDTDSEDCSETDTTETDQDTCSSGQESDDQEEEAEEHERRSATHENSYFGGAYSFPESFAAQEYDTRGFYDNQTGLSFWAHHSTSPWWPNSCHESSGVPSYASYLKHCHESYLQMATYCSVMARHFEQVESVQSTFSAHRGYVRQMARERNDQK